MSSTTIESKQEVLKAYGLHEKDTGSPEVQIALISSRIAGLTDHFKFHKKVHRSRRCVLKLVGLRRSLLSFRK